MIAQSIMFIAWHSLRIKKTMKFINFEICFKQEDGSDFVAAMIKEVQDHDKWNHRTAVLRSSMPPGTKMTLAIWSFKRKRFPDGRLMNQKA